MYRDIKKSFRWEGMKHDIAHFIKKCATYRRVKAEHHRSAKNLQPLPIPEWKCEDIAIDFVVGLHRTLVVKMMFG